jgi:hypothetical protein
MNRPHPLGARGALADHIETAFRNATIVSRTGFGAALLSLLLTGAAPAGAACPDDGGGAIAAACAADVPAAAATASGSAAAAPSAAPDAGATLDEGKRELVAAKKAIEDGERAPDDDARKRAYEEAKRHADRAVELQPNDADARFVQFAAEGRIAQLGGITVAALQLVKLNKQLDEVLRLDPNHANALAARGGMLMKLPRLFGGNTTKGVEFLEKAVALDSTAIGKRLELAEAYHIVGREDDAKATAQNALEVAKQLDEPERIATCQRFIVELAKSCSGCAVESIGR